MIEWRLSSEIDAIPFVVNLLIAIHFAIHF